jgi:bacteriocin biosynthesis cyclodehydratase domain-containing protein
VTTHKGTAFRVAPAWTIAQSGTSLLISGGADALYEVELDDDRPSRFASLGHDDTVTRSELGDADAHALEQLLTAEVVVPLLRTGPTLRVAVVGDASSLALPPRRALSIVPANKAHDLAVVVRATSSLGDLVRALDYERMTIPHLLVDIAFHHTVTIGPLVFPGETACLACLEGRLSTRWGDDAPPPAPAVADEDLGLAAELASMELAKIASGETSLCNATAAWDLRARSASTSQLLKVALCPVCTRNAADRDGSLPLPWVTS